MIEKLDAIDIKILKVLQQNAKLTTKELAEAVKAQLGYDIDKKKMQLSSQIKELGVVRVPIRLHPKVTAELKVNIKEMK